MNTASTSFGHCRRLITALSATTFLLGGLVYTPHAAVAQQQPGASTEQAAPADQMMQAPQAEITRTDNHGSSPKVGDTLTFRIRVTNVNKQGATVFPRLSNLSNAAFQDDATPSCRWIDMPGDDAYNCDSAYHVVTEADLAKASFKPEITLLFSKDARGLEALSPEVTITGAPIEIRHDTELKPLEVSVKRTDRYSAQAQLGNRLTFEVQVKNPNDKPVDVIAGAANLDGFTYTGFGNSCRFIGLKANSSYTCALPFHIVTQEDVDKGSFTPEVSLFISADPDGRSPMKTTKHMGAAIPVRRNPNNNTGYKSAFKVEWIRIDQYGDHAQVGETLRWQARVTNTLGIPITAYPIYTNAKGVLVDGTPNCRWANLGKDETYYCDSIEHTVTQQDVENGSFTPFIVLDGIDPTNVTNTASHGVVNKGETVKISKDRRPAETGERPVGRSTLLAKAGEHGFACHRIPALTSAPNGHLLASWDGRGENCPDAPGANSIIQRISTDGGQTWGEAKVIAQGQDGDNKHGYSDPSYVVDREEKKIFQFFVKSFDRGLADSKTGVAKDNRDVLHAAVIESSDNGQKWSEPRIITEDITTEPNKWTARFAASGEGIQLQHGDKKGRLIQQFTVVTGSNPLNPKRHYQAVSVYSDDHGKTWKVGKPFGEFMDENKVVELADGTLLLNSRSSGDERFRKVATSTDGGETWTAALPAAELVDPQNNASIIRAFPDAPAGSPASKVLLFSNARDARTRRHGAISISYDNGKTWKDHRFFAPEDMSYSTLTHLRDAQGKVKTGQYGLLYEGATSEIRYVTIDAKWLGIEGISREVDPNAKPDTNPGQPSEDAKPNGEANPNGEAKPNGDAEAPKPPATEGPQTPAPPAAPDGPNAPAPNGPGAPQTPAPPAAPTPPRPVPPPAGPAPAPRPAPQPAPPAAPAPQPAPPAAPAPEPQGPRTVQRVAGETRFETAVALSRQQVKDRSAKTVIIARSEIAPDSVSAVPLAKALDAPVLLTPHDALHPAVADELKRILTPDATVIFMGGEVALNRQVEDAVKALGAKVERVAGPNRAATAVATANRLKDLGKAKEILLADGNDWQVDLIAGPAAAKVEGVTLLTNGNLMAPETAAFLAANTQVNVTGVGANGAAQAAARTKITAPNATALSLEVAKRYFPTTAAAGVATTADFADALAGGAYIAHADGPLVLVPTTTPQTVRDWLTQAKVRQVTVFGGPARISDTQMAGLTE